MNLHSHNYKKSSHQCTYVINWAVKQAFEKHQHNLFHNTYSNIITISPLSAPNIYQEILPSNCSTFSLLSHPRYVCTSVPPNTPRETYVHRCPLWRKWLFCLTMTQFLWHFRNQITVAQEKTRFTITKKTIIEINNLRKISSNSFSERYIRILHFSMKTDICRIYALLNSQHANCHCIFNSFSPMSIFWYTLDHNSRQLRLRQKTAVLDTSTWLHGFQYKGSAIV